MQLHQFSQSPHNDHYTSAATCDNYVVPMMTVDMVLVSSTLSHQLQNVSHSSFCLHALTFYFEPSLS